MWKWIPLPSQYAPYSFILAKTKDKNGNLWFSGPSAMPFSFLMTVPWFFPASYLLYTHECLFSHLTLIKKVNKLISIQFRYAIHMCSSVYRTVPHGSMYRLCHLSSVRVCASAHNVSTTFRSLQPHCYCWFHGGRLIFHDVLWLTSALSMCLDDCVNFNDFTLCFSYCRTAGARATPRHSHAPYCVRFTSRSITPTRQCQFCSSSSDSSAMWEVGCT